MIECRVCGWYGEMAFRKDGTRICYGCGSTYFPDGSGKTILDEDIPEIMGEDNEEKTDQEIY